jgi:transcription antitermination factor NusG
MVPMHHTDSLEAPAWYAVQVWVGREQLSARHLELRGYHIFMPTYLEHRRWSDRVKKIQRALFPGYVFCQIDRGCIATIVGTPGVIRLVGDGVKPQPVPARDIDSMLCVMSARLRAEPWPFLGAGQRVRIGNGPLKDLEGIVLRTRNQHRIVMSIPLLQRSIAVEIDRGWLSDDTQQ